MRITSPWLWFGGIVLVVAGAAGFKAYAAGGEDHAPDAGQCFIRVGDYYINASRIDYAFGDGDGVLVVFGSEAGNRLRLSGPDAQAMRRWLGRHSPAQEDLRSQRGGSSTRPGSRGSQAHEPSSGDAPTHSGESPQHGQQPSPTARIPH